MSLVAEALWEQRRALRDAAPRLRQLRGAVNAPTDQSLPGWAQLYALALHFRPDLIVELGRGDGNSTAAFTEAANALGGCTVLSVDVRNQWEARTVPRLNAVVDPGWYAPLRALTGDITELAFAPYIAPAARVLFLWDAHGYALAYHILGNILPLLQGRAHLTLVHDISDIRYNPLAPDYVRFDGMPTYWTDHLAGPFSELFPLYDFLTRNRIAYGTAAHDFQTLRADPARWPELDALWADAYGPDENPAGEGYFVYFTLDDRADPDAPLAFPDPRFGRYLASEFVWNRHTLARDAGLRAEDIFRIRELARAILVRLRRALHL